MINKVALSHGRVYPIDGDGWAVAVWFVSSPARDGLPQKVELSLQPPGDTDAAHVELRVGDTFPIGRASWRLVAVEDPDTWDYVVRIERVPEPGEPAGRPAVGPDLGLDLGLAELIGRVLEFVQFEPRLDD